MSDRIVTVFGGSGFIGRHVVRELAQRGYRVRAAMRLPSKAGFLRTMGLPGQVEPVYADIRDDASVARALDRADMAVNLVGILYESGPQRFDALQAQGAGRVARLAREAGAARLVQMSAIGADAASDVAYARSKAEGERAVHAAFPDAVILRPSIVFGPGDGFFNRFAGIARIAPALPLFGGGTTRFQPVYVDDVADAVCAALTDSAATGKVFELGGPQVFTFRQLMEIVLRQTGRSRLLLPLPWGIAKLMGAVLGVLPAPPLTLGQVKMLQHDNVVSPEAEAEGRTLAAFGIAPDTVEAILPSYLWAYRRQGQYAGGIKADG